MDIVGYFTALGLATAAGLNAWVPLLATGLLARYTDVIHLDGTWDALEQPVVLGVLALIALADFIGDKIPAVDHGLHAVGTVIAPATGVVAALAATGGVDVSSPLIVALGLVAAETAHGTRMAIRPFSTVGTAGVGNPVISLIEDVAAIALSLAAILLPVIALLMMLALFGGGWYAIHRVRRMRAVRAAPA